MLHVRRDQVLRALLAHDEDDLAERVPAVTDEDLKRIGQLAGDYAFSTEHALPSGSSMGGRLPRRKRFAAWAFTERVVGTESTHAGRRF